MDFDFSELEKLHKETFDKAIEVLTNHYDRWVQDDKEKLKALTQIKKETEGFIRIFGENNVDE
jgi:hypothetical protein